jgi:hypothetical protein
MRLMAGFVGEAGPGAAGVIRAMAGGKTEFDLELENAPHLRGTAQRVELQSTIFPMVADVANPKADPGALAIEASAELARLRERRLALRDMERYTDLPESIRAEDAAKTDRSSTTFLRNFVEASPPRRPSLHVGGQVFGWHER